MSLIKFLASPIGRWVRIIAGIILVGLGLFSIQSTGGLVVAVVGLIPLMAGLFDFCVFAPLFGAPFSGKAIRNSH